MAIVDVKSVNETSSNVQIFKNGGDINIIPSLSGKRLEAISRKEAQALLRGATLSVKKIEQEASKKVSITATDLQNPNFVETISQSELMTLQKQAEEGYPLAQLSLGIYYIHRRDFPSALKWLQEAAEQGNTDAQTGMGYMYENGFGVTQNPQKAFDFYLKAASSGNASAQNNIGRIAFEQWKDFNEAKNWFQKALNQGNIGAMVNLGVLYFDEAVKTGKNDDYDTAIKYLHQAAEQDKDKIASLIAKLHLGTLYTHRISKAEKISDKREYMNKACEWLDKAIEQARTEHNDSLLRKAREQLDILSRITVR